MNEIWIRLALVAGVIVVTAGAAIWIRARSRHHPVNVDASGMNPGVYLFSAATCIDCDPARAMLEEALGGDGFVELRWEEQPVVFQRLGIVAVPATLVVGSDGEAKLFPGTPEAAIRG